MGPLTPTPVFTHSSMTVTNALGVVGVKFLNPAGYSRKVTPVFIIAVVTLLNSHITSTSRRASQNEIANSSVFCHLCFQSQ